MTNTQRLALAAVAVVMIALGLFLVLGNDPAPPVTSPAPVAEVGAAPATVTGTGAAPSQPATGAPTVAVVEAGSDAGVAVGKTGPTVEFAPSPFESADSPELQYAVKLVLSQTTGPFEWRKAAEVFQRCVDENPTNHLCKRGVYAAWERIDSDGGMPTALTKTGALGVDPSKLQNPTVRSDGLVAPTLKERSLAE